MLAVCMYVVAQSDFNFLPFVRTNSANTFSYWKTALLKWTIHISLWDPASRNLYSDLYLSVREEGLKGGGGGGETRIYIEANEWIEKDWRGGGGGWCWAAARSRLHISQANDTKNSDISTLLQILGNVLGVDQFHKRRAFRPPTTSVFPPVRLCFV